MTDQTTETEERVIAPRLTPEHQGLFTQTLRAYRDVIDSEEAADAARVRRHGLVRQLKEQLGVSNRELSVLLTEGMQARFNMTDERLTGRGLSLDSIRRMVETSPEPDPA